MRISVALLILALCACAAEHPNPNPPAGVDLSGTWKLNTADSDDAQRIMQAANTQSDTRQPLSAGSGRGGRGGRGGMPGVPVSNGPPPPSMALLEQALRWPGAQLQIKQIGSIVTFNSAGRTRVCEPRDSGHTHRRHKRPPGRDDADAESPPQCGWLDNALLVKGSSDPDEERAPFEESYSLAPDGQRLIELARFTGGRSSGFTVSRVWDRVPSAP